jgi:deoxyribodipyrimidine photo-lyase
MNGDMRRDFESRQDLVDYLRKQFPQAAALDDHVSPTRGGRAAAESALRAVDPQRYGRSRNYLNGAVTYLSPYIRHGVLSMAEVRDYALQQSATPDEAEALIRELGFRDYFQRVYQRIGDAIYEDQEASKTGLEPSDYGDTLPEDIRTGTTSMACMDAFSRQLYETGYLHNHARLWLAAYIIHWRRVRWQAGADWYLTHLLDGDPASNHLSWQWVAGTFSSKPYFFNRENLEKFTNGVYCQACPLYGECDLEGDYAALEARLFKPLREHSGTPPRPRTIQSSTPAAAQGPIQRPVIWVHGDMLSPQHPAFKLHPAAPAIWVWDDDLLQAWKISLKRIVFMYECLLELPVTIQRGKVADKVVAFGQQQQADGIITGASPAPRFEHIRQQLASGTAIQVVNPEPFIRYHGNLELKRFSRYWRTAEAYAFHRSQVQTDQSSP